MQYYVGIDIGGTKILTVVFDENNKIVARDKRKTPQGALLKDVIKTIQDSLNNIFNNSAIEKDNIQTIGIGVPGTVNPETGIVHLAPNLKWIDLPFVKKLGNVLDFPIIIENDVNAATFAESQLGAGKDCRSLVGIFAGTGIGGGLVFENQIWYGTDMIAGEIGHIVVKAKGPRCDCGQRGCLEAMIGKKALKKKIQKAVHKGIKTSLSAYTKKKQQIPSKAFKKALQENDPFAKKLMKNYAKYLGIACGNIINLLNPDCIVLGGGMMESLHKYLFDDIVHYAYKHNMAGKKTSTQIKLSQLGDDAVALGVAIIAKNKKF